MTEDDVADAYLGNSSDADDEATVQDVVRALRDCKGHYSFLIGAGTSKPAGIPTGGDLIWEWKQERYAEEHDNVGDIKDVDDDEIKSWANSYEKSNMKSNNDYGF